MADEAAAAGDTAELEKIEDTASQQAADGAGKASGEQQASDTGTDEKLSGAAQAGEAGKTEEGKDAAAEADKSDTGSDWPEDWREKLAKGDEDKLKLLNRYGSVDGLLRKIMEQEKVIRTKSGPRPMPDASDEKAMSEWRKEQGIPDDPTGYKLPETVTKRMTDDDKPLISSFTDYAHKKGAPQQVVDVASEWYFDTVEQMAAERAAEDKQATEAAEDELRKNWSHAEYKSNMTLGRRFLDSIPGLGADWAEARLPNGRRLGDVPDFVMWASDMGRDKFGDVTFATADSEARHMAEKDEIERIMKTDFERYIREGWDKKYAAILEKEVARKR